MGNDTSTILLLVPAGFFGLLDTETPVEVRNGMLDVGTFGNCKKTHVFLVKVSYFASDLAKKLEGILRMFLFEALKSTDVLGHLAELPFVAFDRKGEYLKTVPIK